MKILIVGAGRVGRAAAHMLASEGHELTVVDKNRSKVDELANALDIICMEGSATSADTLRAAGAGEADLVIACTQLDEVNMVCGIAAAKLGAGRVMARVRDPEYLKQTEFLREVLGLSMVFNPEYEYAKAISRILRFPGAVRVDTFSKSSLEIAEYRVRNGGPLDGIQLKNLSSVNNARVLVSVVERKGEAFIPNGNSTLLAGDVLSMTGSARDLRRFFTATGQDSKPVKRVMIMGGSRTAVYLTRMLEESGMTVTIFERNAERCEALCSLVPDATIIHGDATHSDMLREEGLAETDAFVAITGDDGDNVITSLFAGELGVRKVVMKLNREHFGAILNNTGVGKVISPEELVAQQITGYARAMGASGSGMESLHKLADGRLEAVEFVIGEGSGLTGTPLKDLRLKKDMLICAIIRGDKCIIPNGGSVILPGDHVVIATGAGRLQRAEEALA